MNHAARACAFVWACIALMSSCTPPAPARPPVQASLRIATRTSCGDISTTDYDTSCMTALSILVRDAEASTVLASVCEVIEPRNTLGEILFGDTLAQLSGVSANKKVIVEIRGSHVLSEETADPCVAASDPANWLLWGESGVVDLAPADDNGEGVVIPVVVECRDCEFALGCNDIGDCFGCAAMRNGVCPVALPASYCAPIDLDCARTCQTDDDCFGGARPCINNRCDVDLITGGVCSPCSKIAGEPPVGCDASLQCVGRQGQSRGICAPRCPDEFCPSGTRCVRRGNGLQVIE
jgi:hypothetical protein